MSYKLLKLVKKLNMKKLDVQLVLQCAPLLKGLKMANFFVIDRKQFEQLVEILSRTQISFYLVAKNNDKVYLLLYNESKLTSHFQKKEVRALLKQYGYDKMEPLELLFEFRKRYQKYWNEKTSYPHEMGIFLGYPIEDVVGFIENNGKEFLYSGDWKVYGKVHEKINLFNAYENAREEMIHSLHRGVDILAIIWSYQNKNKNQSMI